MTLYCTLSWGISQCVAWVTWIRMTRSVYYLSLSLSWYKHRITVLQHFLCAVNICTGTWCRATLMPWLWSLSLFILFSAVCKSEWCTFTQPNTGIYRYGSYDWLHPPFTHIQRHSSIDPVHVSMSCIHTLFSMHSSGPTLFVLCVCNLPYDMCPS